MNKRPIIGITMGDPAGNGPELTLLALREKTIYEKCKPIVVGDFKVFEKVKGILNLDSLVINPINSVSEAKFEYNTIDILHLDLIDMDKFQFGKIDKICGNAAFQCVKKVIELANNKEIDGTCTNALSKESMNLALADDNMHFDGHTEIYATYTNTKKYTMLLVHENLRVVHVSTHCSLREACNRVKKDRVLDVIEIANKACKDFGIENPKIALCGLNPHAGENGLFGTEEIEEIIPAINMAREKAIDAEGPFPPDSLFSKALGGFYDIVIAMYHDQGHIPLKTIGFVYNIEEQKWEAVEGVNITLGLPIIRTSVDHGTAFDQAGKGTCSPLSLINALNYAIQMAARRISE
ncbi:MAG: 4-hydroxythreonine-4-phosphate dehydrogenase PdxA [Lachnospirales bacterium]